MADKSKRVLVTVIIKAYNEEETISNSIKSAIDGVKSAHGEVILVDSLSTDKTINIAKTFPIKILQIKDTNARNCSIGAQIGFMNSRGEYIYILDGDMELHKNFIKEGIDELQHNSNIAGVGGIVTEKTVSNIVFRKRSTSDLYKAEKPRFEDKLMMGGLYRRKTIEEAGYFTNPHLHAYEESDLGIRLRSLGYKLKRIPMPMVVHHGDIGSSFKIMINKWKSRYLWGCGEFLRSHFGKPTFLEVAGELRLYIAVIGWWLLLAINLVLSSRRILIELQFVITLFFLLVLFIKKRSFNELIFSIFSWNITALGIILGFLRKPRDVYCKIETVKIK